MPKQTAGQHVPGDTEQLFVKLSDALADADYKKCVKLADSVLSGMKGDKDALKTKLFAQIMLDRFDDALQLIQSSDSIAAEVTFEKAYCLFKTGRLDAALELLQGAGDEGSQHLTAIVHMKQKHSQAASAAYESLVPKVKGNKQAAIELVTNMIAALVMSGEQNRIPRALQQLSVAANDSFEVALNMACAAVLDGQLSEAQRLLQLAETKGQEVLIDEDASQAEIDRELGAVRAQAAHVSFLLGDVEAAGGTYNTLLGQHLQADVALLSVVTNNTLCVRSQHSDTLGKEARKKLAAFMDTGGLSVAEHVDRRLGSSASAALLRNYILSCLLQTTPASQKGWKASKSGDASTAAGARAGLLKAAKALSEAASASEPAMLLHAAAAGMLGTSADACQVIKAWLAQHPAADGTRALLLGAHVAASGPGVDLELGVEMLSHAQLPDAVRHACAVVATRAAMHERLAGADAQARVGKEAEAAVKWWSAQPAGEAQAKCLAACVEHQVGLCLRQGRSAEALAVLKALQGSPAARSAAVRAKLLRCMAAIDPSAAAEIAGDADVTAVTKGVNVKDAEELEVSNIVSKGTSVLLGALVRSGDGEGEGGRSGKQPRKRKRKPRYPKGFDPENPGPPPDPERWLPKHERAEFRKRRKRSQRNQPVSKGAQGMGAVDSSLDKSHITMEDLDARAQPVGGPRLPPRAAPKGSQGKRKGKR